MANNTFQVIAEYIWLDSNNKYRSKTRIMNDIQLTNEDVLYSTSTYPNWSYDGSSCDDNKGIESITECVLIPHAVYNDPFNADTEYFKYTLVLCRNYYYDSYHASDIHILENYEDEFIELIGNGKYMLVPIHSDMEPSLWENETFKSEDIKLGFEQEFFMIDTSTQLPIGFSKSSTSCPFTYIIVKLLRHLGLSSGYLPVSGEQGPYYCGTGPYNVFEREFLNETQTLLLDANINIKGFNYEVAPGQAEFQVFGNAVNACNDLLMTRYILQRNSEYYEIDITFEPVVINKTHGKFNMSGCHTNISFNSFRNLKFMNSFIDENESVSNDTTNTTESNSNTTSSNKMSTYSSSIKSVSDFMNAVEYLYSLEFTNKELFESIFGNNNCNRCTGDLETSNWLYFTWGVGARDTSVRVPLDSLLSNANTSNTANTANTSNKDKMYFEDRRPGSNVEPFTILKYWARIISLIFHSDILPDNVINTSYKLRNMYLSDAINDDNDSDAEDNSDTEDDIDASNTNAVDSIRNRFSNVVRTPATETPTDTDTLNDDDDTLAIESENNESDTTTVVNNNSWFRFLY